MYFIQIVCGNITFKKCNFNLKLKLFKIKQYKTIMFQIAEDDQNKL